MRNYNQPSEKLQKQINAVKSKKLGVGDICYVPIQVFNEHSKSTETLPVKIIAYAKGVYTVHCTNGYGYSDKTTAAENLHHIINKIGANPFSEDKDIVRSIAFSCESILFNLDVLGEKRIDGPTVINGIEVKELNWNPYVIINGEKQYYQRDFVWTLEDNQLLIESIYNRIDCGKILVRKHSWEEVEKKAKAGETELAFNDLVDGKQRLNAVRAFIQGEFQDLHGNCFGDLSASAKHAFTNHQLFSYAELPESTTDEQVLQQFLKLNFAGKPQSKEHLDMVRELHKKVRGVYHVQTDL